MVTRAQMSGKRGRLDDLPIPDDVEVGDYWCESMVELAGLIGARNTLLFVDRFKGHVINVPAIYPENWFVEDVIGERNARIFHEHNFAWNETHTRRVGSKVTIPTGKRELERARLDPIIAAMQANTMTLSEAAEVSGLSVKRLSSMRVRVETAPQTRAWSTQKPRDDRQISIFDVLEEAA